MRLSKMLALAFAVLVLLTVTGCWSQFRGDAAHTGYNPYETILSTSSVSNLFYAWKGATGGPIASSPAVALISGSAVVYVASGDGYLYAFDAFGPTKGCSPSGVCPPLWKYQLDLGFDESSPAVADEVINDLGCVQTMGVQTSVVYVASYDGYLHAIDAAKGCLIWKTPIGGEPAAFSSPAVANGVVYVVTGDLLGSIVAVNAATGVPLWSGAVASYYPSPAVSNGLVYAGDDAGGGTFRAFSTSCSGFCSPLWTSEYLGAFKSSPAVASGVVYVGSDNGNLYAFNAAGCSPGTVCKPLWTGPTGGPVYSSPAVANGVVYVGSNDDNLYAFDAAGITNCTGTVCKPLWFGPTKGPVVSSPAVANGVVYVGSTDGHLYAFDAAGITKCTGTVCRPLTSFPTHDVGRTTLASSPAVSTGWVYVGSSDWYLYALHFAPSPPCGGKPSNC